jgi:hypothetical protein
VERIPVEGMMSHSFKESGFLNHQKVYEKELETVKKKMKEMYSNTQQQEPQWKALSDFYDVAAEYLQLWSAVRVCIVNETILTSQKCKKWFLFKDFVRVFT